jgi:hypothetical protein
MNWSNNVIQGGVAAVESTKKGLLHNRYVLYFVVIVTLYNVVMHALNGNFVTPLLFILIAILTSFFSKNMIVILLLAVALANLVTYRSYKRTGGRCEGMANSDEQTVGEAEAEKETEATAGSDGHVLNVENPLEKKPRMEYKDRKKEFDYIRTKYQDLVKLQDELMKNVGSLEGSMANMDLLVDDVKKNVDFIRKSLPAGQASL